MKKLMLILIMFVGSVSFVSADSWSLRCTGFVGEFDRDPSISMILKVEEIGDTSEKIVDVKVYEGVKLLSSMLEQSTSTHHKIIMSEDGFHLFVEFHTPNFTDGFIFQLSNNQVLHKYENNIVDFSFVNRGKCY